MIEVRLQDLAIAAALTVMAALVPAHATQIVYTTTMAGPNESPPVMSDGVGLSIVTIDTASLTMRVQAVFNGLTGTVTVAHVHCCTEPSGLGNAGVATRTPTFPGFPVGTTFGYYDVTFDMRQAGSWNSTFIADNGGSPASAFTAFVNGMNAGSAYLNIHSTFAPGGEIRGFYAPNSPIPLHQELFANGFE
jgi:hypothetical protein